MNALYGAGLNIHSQLASPFSSTSTSPTNLLSDLRLIERARDIELVGASWSQTVLRIDGRVTVLGRPRLDLDLVNIDGTPPDEQVEHKSCNISGSRQIDSIAMSPSHGLLLFTSSDSVYVLVKGDARELEDTAKHVALTSTHSLAVSCGSVVSVYNDYKPPISLAEALPARSYDLSSDFPRSSGSGKASQSLSPGEQRPPGGRIAKVSSNVPAVSTAPATSGDNEQKTIKDLRATATGFVCLLTTGEILTWNVDSRHPHVLGRDGPVDRPDLLDSLEGVGVAAIKTCCGGWLVGCITVAGEAYLWGRLGGPGSQPFVDDYKSKGIGKEEDKPSDLRSELETGVVLKVRIPGRPDLEDADVVDMDVGVDHVVVLFECGEVWVYNMPFAARAGWHQVSLPSAGTATAVMAGDYSVLVLVEEIP